jgi:hypothetical protein
MTGGAEKEGQSFGVSWRVRETHIMDKMILCGAYGNLILNDACFGMVVVRQLLLVGSVLYEVHLVYN